MCRTQTPTATDQAAIFDAERELAGITCSTKEEWISNSYEPGISGASFELIVVPQSG